MSMTFRTDLAVSTPGLVIDIASVDANIARLQAALDQRSVALRPHAKTHKSVAIARRQLGAGARGLTVGTLGEAEVFAAAGMRDLFVAYTVWAEGDKAARLRDLHDGADLRVGVDSAPAAQRLAAAVAGSRHPLRVLVEIDSGGKRTGVASPDVAVDVAKAALAFGLAVDGVFTHGGHSYAMHAGPTAAADEVAALEGAAGALEDAGIASPVLSAGSTPTMVAAASGRVNEIRAGTYVLGDRQQWALGAIGADDMAAFVVATVVSSAPDRFVLDAGAKSLTKDRAEWLDGFGYLPAYPDATIARLSDYHAVVLVPEGAQMPVLGERVAIVPNHICPVVDLYDAFIALLPDGSVERWPVDARGRSG